jgi:hypothetical protein
MSTFKADLFEICNEVAAKFPGWSFVSGQFKNKTLKHTDLLIHPGFAFRQGTTPVQPSVVVDNKRADILAKRIFGGGSPVSSVSLQVVAHTLERTPEKLRLGFWIVQNKEEFLSVGQPSQAVRDKVLDITESHSALMAMMEDGIAFIENHYNLSSEESLLRALPAKYTTRHANSPYDEMDRWKGVMVCVIHVLLGDFDFVDRYLGDDFETIFPKRKDDLEKIVAAMPDLKRHYAETGSVI